MLVFNQLKLLLWKNYLIQKRSVKSTALEVVLLIFLIGSSRLSFDFSTLLHNKSSSPQFFIQNASQQISGDLNDTRELNYIRENACNNVMRVNKILYAPKITETKKLVDNIPNVTFSKIGFQSEKDLLKQLKEKYFLNCSISNYCQCFTDILGVVIFDNEFSNDIAQLKYRIRLPNSDWIINGTGRPKPIFNTKIQWHVKLHKDERKNDVYWKYGFLTIQRAIDLAAIKYYNSNFINTIDFSSSAFPKLADGVKTFGRPSLLMPFVVIFIFIIRNLMREKEKGLREYMKVMGMQNWVQWMSHFIWNLFKMIIISIFCTLIFWIPINGRAIFGHSDPSFIFIFILLSCVSLICYAFAVSVFFQSAVPAMTAGALLYYAASSVATIAVNVGWLDGSNSWTTFSPLTLGQNLGYMFILFFTNEFGFNLIGKFENKGVGMQWKYLFSPINSDYNITMGLVMIMLIVDIIICLLITWYFDALNPGTKGQSQKLWFPFQLSYWRGNSKDVYNLERKMSKSTNKIDKVKREEEPNREATIYVTDLVKTFKKGRVKALDLLNIKIYSNEITALLGHNGAGKTTTMKIISGLLSSEMGTVTICGYNLENSSNEIRSKLGLCPQDNVLFDILTVEEHLKLFCRLKGQPINQNEIDTICSNLHLSQNTKVAVLSGGMKRKLQVAIALIGHSEIVILDEPTSGIDPLSRRKIWEFLKEEKTKRTIILSTHYMDEADFLGDRIAILAKGKLQCYGSSLFLKKHYGTGYNLTVVFEREKQNTKKTQNLIQGHCSEAKLQSTPGNLEATFSLPEKYKENFVELFSELETKQQDLGISSFGISLTTMEDVFLKVGQIAEEEEKPPFERSGVISIEHALHLSHNLGLRPLELNEGSLLWVQRFVGMLVKRFHYFRRKWSMVIPQFILPLVMAVICIAIVKSIQSDHTDDSQSIKNMPPLEFNMKSFGKTIAPITIKTTDTTVNKTATFYEMMTATKPVENITNFIIQQYSRTNEFYVEKSYIVGAEFIKSDLTALHQIEALHGEPISINLLHTALLRAVTDDPRARITTLNHPLPFEIFPETEAKPENHDGKTHAGGDLVVTTVLMPFGLGILLASFVLFEVKENVSGFKHLQILTGTHPVIFWLSSFIWDYCIYLITATTIFALFAIFQIIERGILPNTFVVFWLYGFAAIPRIYLIGLCFRSPGLAFGVSIILCSIFGTLATTILRLVAHDKSVLTAIIPFLLPSYGLSEGLSGHQTQIIALSFIGTGVVYWLAILSVEIGYVRKMYETIKRLLCAKLCSKALIAPETYLMDSDIQAENDNIQTLDTNTPLITNKLTKSFNIFKAVNSLSFHVDSHDCFGLLGVNGAGKTTTFQMLVGKHDITSGQATVCGMDVATNWRKAGVNLGYCPQFDALIGRLTTKETLTLFARLRGCPEKQLKRLVSAAIDAVGIVHYTDKIVKTCSGGTRRCLSVGVALVCLPNVLILDEPTSGVDPAGRRQIWELLTQLRHHGLAILMSSHCMDECEALCTKVAVMVKGQLACIGSPQYLKTKYGKGYIVQIKIANIQQVEYAKELMDETFPGCVLKEVNNSILHYELPNDETTTWSSLFRAIGNLVEPLNIVDYSISQTTLEQIFHNLSKESF